MPHARTISAQTATLSLTLLAILLVTGCSGGFSARTARMRTALDQGDPHGAIAHLSRELGVTSGGELPKKLSGDDALLVLDRATVHQAVAHHARSKRDYEVADKAIDAIDLARGTADDIAKWTLSDSAGRYVAPPHEKLLVNVLNMVNYLDTGDLSGARVEARRLNVTARYLREREHKTGERSAVLGMGSLLAGFAYEKSGNADEARLYYDYASGMDAGRTARERAQAATARDDWSEALIVVGWGRVPHRVARHVPIGLALTRASPFLAAGDRQQADEIAAQGLVTWVAFPELAPDKDLSAAPTIEIDGRPVALDATLDVSAEVRAEWRRIEGAIMAAAVSRAVTRAAAGAAIRSMAKSSEKKEVRAVGFLLSLVAQVALVAADTPDTRSWETLPARLGLARVRVAPGAHSVVLAARGHRRTGTLRIAPGGWGAASLFALR